MRGFVDDLVEQDAEFGERFERGEEVRAIEKVGRRLWLGKFGKTVGTA